MKKIILIVILFVGCASGKIQDSNIKIADTIKVAEEINPQVKIVAGVDKSQNVEQKAERDIIQINDTALMKFIIGKIMDKLAWIIGSVFAFLLSLFSGIWGMLKYQSVMYNKLLSTKDVWIANLIKSADVKDEKNDEWLRAKINGGGK